MLKQILSKIPRKSAKLEQSDGGEIESANSSSNTGTPCTSGGNSFSNRLSVVKRVSSVVFPASVMAGLEAVEPHLSFKDVSILQKQSLFLSKLNFCCEVSDINDVDKNVDHQDLKRQILMDLVDFVSAGSAKFNEPAIAAMCKMCAVNLFRVFPPKYLSNSSGRETEHEEPIFDPAWPHLQLVYDLFLKFVDSTDVKVAKKHLNHSFILKILDLFDSEDPRERDCLKTLLHKVYGKFMVHRPYIRKAVGNIIYRFVFETECHNGIAELLEVFGSVISGFAVPLKDEHKIFLQRALIPLHKPKSMGVYHQQLTYSIVQFIDKDPQLATIVIKGLLKYWPITNSQKEMMFISELEEILEITPMDVFQKIMVPLFRRLGSCLYSSHYQVAERAHLLWNNERILNLVSHNRQVIMPLIFPALERNAQSHWNRAVINLTQNTKKMFSEMDEELALTCQRKLVEEDSMIGTLAEKRRLIWERLEMAANFKPVAGSGTIVPSVKSLTCSVAC